jgi:glyoxylase-like metal-dependent hydrolase (beta-lactamase superfamily II)
VFAACQPQLLVIVLTHRHLDHSEGAALLAERAGCGVRAADPEFRVGADGLAGETCSPSARSRSRSSRRLVTPATRARC